MQPANNDAAHNAAPLTEFSQNSEAHHLAPTGRLGAILQTWSNIENTIVGVLAAISLGIVVYTIVIRLLVPSLTPAWADEMTIYFMVWATLIACSGVTAKNRHVRADLVTNGLSRERQIQLEFASYICGAAFTAVLAWYGFFVTKDAFTFGDLSTTTLRFPMWIYYACLPVGAGLMMIRYLVLIGLTAASFRTRSRDIAA